MNLTIAPDVTEFSISSNVSMDEHGRTVRKTFAHFDASRYAIGSDRVGDLPPVFEISLEDGFSRETHAVSRCMSGVSVRIVDREIPV